MKRVHEFTDGDYPVLLEQRTDLTFRVTYGVQVYDRLSYRNAAEEYGLCVFHSLACASKLDNAIDD